VLTSLIVIVSCFIVHPSGLYPKSPQKPWTPGPTGARHRGWRSCWPPPCRAVAGPSVGRQRAP